jgi:hypothetical protein
MRHSSRGYRVPNLYLHSGVRRITLGKMPEQSLSAPQATPDWKVEIERVLAMLAVIRTMSAMDETAAAELLKQVLNRLAQGDLNVFDSRGVSREATSAAATTRLPAAVSGMLSTGPVRLPSAPAPSPAANTQSTSNEQFRPGDRAFRQALPPLWRKRRGPP